MQPSIESIKQLILRCYRKTDPRELDGLKKTLGGGYITSNQKWVYFVRHGGFIEREPGLLIILDETIQQLPPLQWVGIGRPKP